MPLYVRSLERCTMFLVHIDGSQASRDLRLTATLRMWSLHSMHTPALDGCMIFICAPSQAVTW